jgi:hypothetical protein
MSHTSSAKTAFHEKSQTDEPYLVGEFADLMILADGSAISCQPFTAFTHTQYVHGYVFFHFSAVLHIPGMVTADG